MSKFGGSEHLLKKIKKPNKFQRLKLDGDSDKEYPTILNLDPTYDNSLTSSIHEDEDFELEKQI